jgi:LCP family protein required for cell wall assembly
MTDEPRRPSRPPKYTRYRASPKLRREPVDGEELLDELRDQTAAAGVPRRAAKPKRGEWTRPVDDGTAAPAAGAAAGTGSGGPREPRPPRSSPGARPQSGGGRRRRDAPARGGGRVGGLKKPITFKRVVVWIVLALVGWVALSLVLFLISAQIRAGDLKTGGQLDGGGPMPLATNNILLLGSDQRPKGSKEGGANAGPSRADSIMLMRLGGGSSSALSVPRDTLVNIPGHGINKINAAYAFGGAPLMIKTLKSFLGVDINHVILINFTNFPDLIDAMGGVDIKTDCVKSKINGGYKNGGITLNLHSGTHHLNGKQALALARTRHNACNPAEDDLTRARRQQQLIAAMKGSVLSLGGFVRLPFISWNVPKALSTDMGGPTLMGMFLSLGLFGSPPPHVLKPTGVATLPDGEQALTITPASKQRQVKQFEGG